MDIQLLRDYIAIRNRREELVGTQKTPLNSIFDHEAGNLLTLDMFREAAKNNLLTKNKLADEYKRKMPLVPKIKRLLPLTYIKDFSKEYLTSSNTNLYEVLSQEKNSNEKSYGIEIKISGNIPESIPLEESTLAAMISTNIGDAIKWSPKGKNVKIKGKNLGDKLRLRIENSFGSEPVEKDIGMGKKIGSQYTELFMDTIEEKRKEKSQKLPFMKYGKFVKEFYLPLK